MDTYVPDIITRCPNCNSKLQCPARMKGNRKTCPDCAELVDIPYKSDASVARGYNITTRDMLFIAGVGITFGIWTVVAPPPKREKQNAPAILTSEELAQEREKAREYRAGPKPMQSSWDGSIYVVKVYLEKRLRDPNSVQYIEWSGLVFAGDAGWKVRVKYRAKNGFGGYVTSTAIALIRDGRVISMTGIN